MARVSPLLILPPAIFAAMAGLFFAGMMREDAGVLPSTIVGQAAPGVPTEAVSGTVQLTDADLRGGEITIVNFWASWCPPCRAEHPKLLEMAGQGMPIIGINFRDQQGTANAYLTKDGNPFVGVAFDLDAATSFDWGVTAPPETFILDGDGTILYRFTGPLIGADYEQRFLPELQKALAAQDG